MNVCNCIPLSVALSVLLLGNSCKAVKTYENRPPEKLYKHSVINGNMESVLKNDGPSVKSHIRRPRELLIRDQCTELKDDFQALAKNVSGLQGEFDLFDKSFSKQRKDVEENSKDLFTVKNNISDLQENILIVNGALEHLENDTKKLESTLSDSNIQVQNLHNMGKESMAKISKLEIDITKLKRAVSEESLNKMTKNLISAAVLSTIEDIQQQVSELKSALEKNSATLDTTSAPGIAMDELLEVRQQILELKQKCVSKDELKQNLQDVREVRDSTKVVNKCSVSVRHKPQDGRTDFRLIMDPPNTEGANCK